MNTRKSQKSRFLSFFLSFLLLVVISTLPKAFAGSDYEVTIPSGVFENALEDFLDEHQEDSESAEEPEGGREAGGPSKTTDSAPSDLS